MSSEQRAEPRVTELRALARLAIPLAAGHAGNQLMSLVDAAVVGRLGVTELGGVGISIGIYLTVLVFGIGCVLGMEPLVAQAVGAGDLERARRIFWQGARVAVGISAPLAAVLALTLLVLPLAGVEADTAAVARRFMFARLLDVLPALLATACRAYLQARGVTRPIVVAMVVANIANLLGNALLVHGDGALRAVGLPAVGLPALGVVGSGLSTVLASTMSVLVLGRAIARLKTPDAPGRRHLDLGIVRRILTIGLPVGLQMIAEVGVFGIVGVLAGRLGPQAAAGHQVAFTLASFTYTVGLGVGAAASVRVGWAVGAGNAPLARRAGFAGIGLAIAFVVLTALAFWCAPVWFARIVSDDPIVIVAAVPVVRVAALYQIVDAAQVAAAGALRGAADTRAPLWAHVIGNYVLGLPLAVLLGFTMKLGAPGLWWGLFLGLAFVALGLVVRFHFLSRRATIPRA